MIDYRLVKLQKDSIVVVGRYRKDFMIIILPQE